MTGEALQEAFLAGRRVYGSLITSPSPKTVQEIAKANLDFVFIDTEHIPMDREKLAFMCQSYTLAGLAPIVRIPEPDPYLACMALDGGAAGILAPYLETVEQVKALRGAVKLRPLKGARMQAALDGEKLDDTTAAYLKNYNKGRLLILNIESRRGMENLDVLIDVGDVDGVIIGPHDLSINMGVPEQYDAPVFDEAVTRIIKTARARGVGAGIHYSYGTGAMVRWAKAGMNIVLYSSDITLFLEGINRSMNEIHAGLGEAAAVEGGAVDI